MKGNKVFKSPWERVSPILVTLTSHSDSNFEPSNISLKENKPDGVDPNPNGFYFCVQKKEGRSLRFSADWIDKTDPSKIKFCQQRKKQLR